MYRNLIILFLAFLCVGAAPTRVATYTTQTTIRSADVTNNENAIFNYLQAGVDTYAPASILNAAVSSSAAIAYSKLNLTGGIVNSDINSSAAIAYSKLNLLGNIVNADISASAAIDASKVNLASPGAIGGTIPAAGSFTTLSASTSITRVNTITEFSTDGTLGDNSDSALPTEKAVKTYADTKVDGYGSWAAGTFNAATQVTEDGSIQVVATSETCTYDPITIKTDSSNPPTTVRAVVYCDNNNSTNDLASATTAIKKNDYYLVEDPNAGWSSETVYFLPLAD